MATYKVGYFVGSLSSTSINRLLAKGLGKVAQKVGEEGVETALAGAGESEQKVIEESADLLFHLLVLLRARGLTLAQVVRQLESRHR